MILLAEDPQLLSHSSSRDDIARSLEAARIAGAHIFTIAPDFSQCETAENALWYIPAQTQPTPAVWLGYIPDAERYRAIYEAANAKNVRLFNTPDQHQRAQEFDVAYPYIEDLTPRSLTMFTPADYARAAQKSAFRCSSKAPSNRAKRADGALVSLTTKLSKTSCLGIYGRWKTVRVAASSRANWRNCATLVRTTIFLWAANTAFLF